MYFARAWIGGCTLAYGCVATLRATLEAGRAYFVTMHWKRGDHDASSSNRGVLAFIPIPQERIPQFRAWLETYKATRVELDPHTEGATGIAHWSNGDIASSGAKRLEHDRHRSVVLGDSSMINWPD